MADSGSSNQYIQVVVDVQDRQGEGNIPIFSIDPWDNCPSEVGKEEGWLCQECEFWGREVQGIDWAEFSLCSFK
jgi:hypothetical protein